MKIAVLADDVQWEELTAGKATVEWVRITSLLVPDPAVDAYCVLQAAVQLPVNFTNKPVLLNSVLFTLKELQAPANVYRINGWRGFLKREKWEMAGVLSQEIGEIAAALQKELYQVSDTIGLVAARTIAMIVNEAYFALEQEISTKSEIDTAMKLGTNYPYGPFEWAGIIGIANIYQLLERLQLTDRRYSPSQLLKKEAIS